MKAHIKPIKNLEDVKNIGVGDVVGMRQPSTGPVYSLCVKREKDRLFLIGDLYAGVIGGGAIIKYNFLEKHIGNFGDDPNIEVSLRNKNANFVDKDSEEYEPLRKLLIGAKILEEKK